MSVKKQDEEKSKKVCVFYAIGLTAALLVLYWIVYAVDNILPTPLYKSDEVNHPDAFIAERAYDYLEPLVAMGPKVVGSHENELLAVQYLTGAITEIADTCRHPIDHHIQKIAGSYYLDYEPYGSINSYKSLQNVVVKLTGKSGSSSSVLVNSHFDTVPESPGGSDDGIMVAVMLEVLRKMCQLPDRFDNNLIFLFNGAEESYLHGSHGYITSENVTEHISVIINLEATGAGGKEILFQAGPEQEWLMNYYKEVPHPHAQAAGEEIFQSNMIPSDTDFRIFREFGDTIGYDMAYTRNGYRYHNEYDGIHNLEMGTFQHTGDNVLALVKGLSNAPEVRESKKEASKPVYYDFLGLMLISYDKTGEIIVNVVTILCSVGTFIFCYYQMKEDSHVVRLTNIGFLLVSILCGWIAGTILVLITVFLLDLLNNTMSWYRNMWLIFGLYCVPIVLCMVASVIIVDKIRNVKSPENKIEIELHLVRLIWTLVLFIGTCAGIRSVYFLVFPILFTSIAFAIIYIAKLEKSINKWIFVYLIATIMPTLLTQYFGLELFSLFIPITGRMGSSTNPELIIGGMAILLTIMTTSYFVPLISMVAKPKYYIILLSCTFMIFLILVLTPFGFPYQGYSDDPRPQRLRIFHTSRSFRDESGIFKQDSGFTFENMDRNSPRALEKEVKLLRDKLSLDSSCDSGLYCGIPVEYVTTEEEIRKNVWIETTDNPPIIENPVVLTPLTRETGETYIEFKFSVTGTNHFNVYLSAVGEAVIEKISTVETLPGNVPHRNGNPTYFMLFVDGDPTDGEPPFEFSVRLSNLQPGANLEIATAGTYYDSKNTKRTEDYEFLLSSLPDWTTVAPWLGSYESYLF